MDFKFRLRNIPDYARFSILVFLISLSFGYFTGLLFVEDTTKLTTEVIELNYNGNEINEIDYDLELNQPMKFKKSKKEIITIIHTHVLSFSLIFLALGGLLCFTKIPIRFKKILLIEPFISILLTFGGIWLIWEEITWMKYIVMISGTLLTITFIINTFLIIYELFRKKNTS